MKRFKWKVLFLGIALLVLIGGIAGCSPQNLDDSAVQYGPMQDRSVHYPLTVKDQTGNLVQIEKEPQRIVSLMPSNTELLFALGAGKQVVGVTDQDDYPEEVKNLPKVSAFQINAEQVVALKPDLVVASSGNEKEVLDQLKKMGIPVLVADPQSTKEIYEAIVILSQATNHLKEADQLVAKMEKQLRTVYAKVAQVPEEKRVKVWIELDDNLYTVGGDTFMHELLQLAGGKNVAQGLKGWPKVSPEQVVKWNPDVIVSLHGNTEEIKKRAGWQSIRAIQEGRVYALEPDLLSRPGPRVYEGVKQLAETLYPDRFGESAR
ncbi:MAG: ABC transporter substrate-binding protein [Thermoactinomyces vulgaris]